MVRKNQVATTKYLCGGPTGRPINAKAASDPPPEGSHNAVSEIGRDRGVLRLPIDSFRDRWS
jgi:hypothetical protein